MYFYIKCTYLYLQQGIVSIGCINWFDRDNKKMLFCSRAFEKGRSGKCYCGKNSWSWFVYTRAASGLRRFFGARLQIEFSFVNIGSRINCSTFVNINLKILISLFNKFTSKLHFLDPQVHSACRTQHWAIGLKLHRNESLLRWRQFEII